MKAEKSFIIYLSEAIEHYRSDRRATQSAAIPSSQGRVPLRLLQWFLPNGGTILLLVALVLTQGVWAKPELFATAATQASTGTIAYQGRLADASGAPLTGTYNMSFRLYAAASSGTPLWEEQWTGSNSVQVSDGLFNIMLGSLTPIPQDVITGNSNLFLGITVGTDSEMVPRVQLGSVPFAVQALTVPDASITLAKLAPDVSFVPPDGSITTAKLEDGAVTFAKLASGLAQVAQDNQPGESNITGTTAFQDKCNVTMTTSGGPVLLLASFNHVRIGDGNEAMQVRLTVDGVEKKNSGNLYSGVFDNVGGALVWIEAGLPAGSHTFKLQFAVNDPNDTAYIEQANLVVMELK